MIETKRCCGYKGHWVCSDKYPDDMVAVEAYGNNHKTQCKRCMSYRNALVYKAEARHPLNNQSKRHWKRSLAKSLGGVRGTPGWQSLLDEAEKEWVKAFAETNDKDANTTPRHKSEFGQSTPMTKRETTVVEGEQVPEGWVYVVYNPDVPSVLKIGKTFPDGIPSIMSSARRFGRAELADKFWFDEAYKAEQAIHTVLSGCNLRALGYSDCGVELFKCNLNDVKGAIENAIR